ncbi:MAG TPA: adenosine deaminase [Gemmatimonadaceae bacterium]|nr:adenosine deaminase [Gemmatimonadaceae bacterium]
MPAITRELLRALPKAELHCHLDGSIRPSTLIDLGREYKRPMPAPDADALAEHMVVRDAHNLEDYLARFATTLSVLQHADALERVAYELIEDAALDGVRYIEMRFAPVLNTRSGLSLGETVDATLRGIARGERDHGTRGRVILCGLRQLSPDVSLELARLAVAYRDRGVVGFDLAGAERDHPARDHAAAFALAHRNDLALTVHAGEGDGPGSVRQAVHDCGADRLGHATRLIEDERLTRFVNDRRIALEVCITSNVQTRAVASYDAHPVRQYFDRGMNVVLNTDNRLMSGTTLTDEYLHAARHLGFTFAELATIARNGFASAFTSWADRTAMLAEADREIARLAACP